MLSLRRSEWARLSTRPKEKKILAAPLTNIYTDQPSSGAGQLQQDIKLGISVYGNKKQTRKTGDKKWQPGTLSRIRAIWRRTRRTASTLFSTATIKADTSRSTSHSHYVIPKATWQKPNDDEPNRMPNGKQWMGLCWNMPRPIAGDPCIYAEANSDSMDAIYQLFFVLSHEQANR